MSLSNALNSAISGLKAQSAALSSISSNIANASTVGFKSTSTSFESFVNKTTFTTESTGGVVSSNYRNVGLQGEIQTSTTTTNLAINGSGYFVVSDETADGTMRFTRNGTFDTDSDGYLVNQEGDYLYAWPLDENGAVTSTNSSSLTGLEAVNLSNLTGAPKATTEIAFGANLPSDAAVGDDFSYDVEIFDSLGVSHALSVTWTKTADNAWSMDAANPTLSSDSSTTSGTVSGFPVAIAFNTDGSLASVTPSPATLAVASWTSGATDSSITFDLGTANGTDGLTQYASGDDDPDISVETATQDGYEPGQISGTEIDENGVVYAAFDNGETRPVYQIPLATFTNPNGLASETGSTFLQTAASGAYVLRSAGEGGAGDVQSSALEASSVEMTDEFSRMITAQQAYTAASKVVTTTQDMIDTLLAMKR